MELTSAEINHLIGVLQSIKEEGCYFGHKQQYWNRHEKLVAKLENELKKIQKKKILE